MDREKTEALFAEAERLRMVLVEASTKLTIFTEQLRDALEDAEEETP